MPSENSRPRPRPRPIPIRVRRNGPYVKISQNPGLTVESNGIRPEEQTRCATFDEPGRSSVTNVLQRQADQDAYYNKQFVFLGSSISRSASNINTPCLLSSFPLIFLSVKTGSFPYKAMNTVSLSLYVTSLIQTNANKNNNNQKKP